MKNKLAYAGAALLAGVLMLPNHEAFAHGGVLGGGHGGGGFHSGGFGGRAFYAGGLGGREFGHLAGRGDYHRGSGRGRLRHRFGRGLGYGFYGLYDCDLYHYGYYGCAFY